MLAKCANPNCSSRFLYLHEGRLFRIERTEPAAGKSAADRPYLVKNGARHIEHYWLCPRCAELMTLSFDPASGVVTVPLPAPAVARRAIAS